MTGCVPFEVLAQPLKGPPTVHQMPHLLLARTGPNKEKLQNTNRTGIWPHSATVLATHGLALTETT